MKSIPGLVAWLSFHFLLWTSSYLPSFWTPNLVQTKCHFNNHPSIHLMNFVSALLSVTRGSSGGTRSPRGEGWPPG